MSEPLLPFPQAQKAWKRDYFLSALEQAHGHQGRAADMIGVHRNTMGRLLREVGLTQTLIRSYLRAKQSLRSKPKETPIA